MTSTQHPTLAGVTVFEFSTYSHWTERSYKHRVLQDSDDGFRVEAGELGSLSIEGHILVKHAETVIAMIRDQAAWLQQQIEGGEG